MKHKNIKNKTDKPKLSERIKNLFKKRKKEPEERDMLNYYLSKDNKEIAKDLASKNKKERDKELHELSNLLGYSLYYIDILLALQEELIKKGELNEEDIIDTSYFIGSI